MRVSERGTTAFCGVTQTSQPSGIQIAGHASTTVPEWLASLASPFTFEAKCWCVR